jgi:hypothetical protein
VESIAAFCMAAAKQLSGAYHRLPDLVTEVNFTMLLTQDQQQGCNLLMQLSSVHSALAVTHLPALLGLCWSGQDIDNTVDKDSDDSSAEFERGLLHLETTSAPHDDVTPRCQKTTL